MKRVLLWTVCLVVLLAVGPVPADALVIELSGTNIAGGEGSIILDAEGTSLGIAGTYGNFTISSISGTPGARVFATDGASVDRITLTDAIITATQPGTLTIEFSHTFTTIPAGTYPYAVTHFAIFGGPGTATGNRILTSAFLDNEADQINQFGTGSPASLFFTVPANTVSTSNSQTEKESIFCRDGANTGEIVLNTCSPTLSLLATFVFLGAGDRITLRGSLDALGALTDADLDQALAEIEAARVPVPSGLLLTMVGLGVLGAIRFASYRRGR